MGAFRWSANKLLSTTAYTRKRAPIAHKQIITGTNTLCSNTLSALSLGKQTEIQQAQKEPTQIYTRVCVITTIAGCRQRECIYGVIIHLSLFFASVCERRTCDGINCTHRCTNTVHKKRVKALIRTGFALEPGSGRQYAESSQSV